MRILNHNIELNFRAKREWNDFRVFEAINGFHLVWGRLSFSVDQNHLEEIEVHKYCGGLIRNIGPDGISFCEECETIAEGHTEYMTVEEWEKL